jgi:hypothetical protein
MSGDEPPVRRSGPGAGARPHSTVSAFPLALAEQARRRDDDPDDERSQAG